MSRFLESNTKFGFSNHRAKSVVSENTFASWSNNNFYRTSYNDMSVKTPTKRNNSVIPGYAGYVPRVKANNQFIGKRITEQSRQVFRQEILDQAGNNFSTTGFNAKLIPKEDHTMEARSRRYGTCTMFNTAKNMHPEDYFTTTTRMSFVSPKMHDKPNLRSRDTTAVFENSQKLKVMMKSHNLASGYGSNRQEWDGTTWKTEKNLHTDQMRTSYRNGFNCDKPFHKPALKMTDGRLKRKQQVFDVSDK